MSSTPPRKSGCSAIRMPAHLPLFRALTCLGCAIAPDLPAATFWPVGKCGDMAGKGGDTLRIAIGKAASGDVVDMSSLPLACSTITLTGGQIPIPQQSLFIWGPLDRTVTVTAGNTARVFYHSGGGSLYLRDFEVAYGTTSGSGGCIYSSGAARLDHVTVSQCHASQAGGAVAAHVASLFYSSISGASAGVAGGGIAVFGGASCYLDHSTITGNTAPIGGGVYSAGNVTSSHSMLSNNQANSGGGVFANGLAGFDYTVLNNNVANAGGGGAYARSAFLLGSQVSYNSADYGGGLVVFGSTTVRSSTLSGNVAAHKGGGMYVKIANGVPAVVYNSTISANSASNGGGAYVITVGPTIGAGAFGLFNSTVAFNHAQTGSGGLWVASPNILFYSSILAKNDPQDFAASPVIAHNTAASVSLIMNGDEIPAGTLRADPRLAPLALRGGALPTHALVGGSPAVNHGANPKDLDFDERGSGYARTVNVTDIGAYERQLNDDELFYGGFD